MKSKVTIEQELVKSTIPELPRKRDFKIGVVGSGAIIKNCHLNSYQQAEFSVHGISSRTYENARITAEEFNIPNVYDSWEEMIADPEIEIIDIAVPPHLQTRIVAKCCEQQSHIKGILCQKPAALTRSDLMTMKEQCEQAGIIIAVNQNMRYDQSIRALKYALNNGYLGEPVLATLELRARSDWRDFYYEYGKVEMMDLGIHHMDAMRFLFGNPEKVNAVCRTDPRLTKPHIDGLSQYNLMYSGGLIASILDDTYAGPAKDCAQDIYIRWRVEGTDGLAKGSIGWPFFPDRVPSTFALTTKQFPGEWLEPTWQTSWFPDAFKGTMGALLIAVENGEQPVITLDDHDQTLACVEACYQSVEQERTINI